MAREWTGNWGGLVWTVESRSLADDSGNTLRLKSTEGPHEWLRFDCFTSDPHWHLDPTGRDERHRLDTLDGAITETFSLLRDDLPGLLTRAGAPATLVEALEGSLSTTDGQAFLRDAERAMRHREPILEELDIRLLEIRRSAKWHIYPRDVLPAWVAEMDFPVAAPIQDELCQLTERADLGYPIGLSDTGLPEVFSMRMQERFDWSPDPCGVEVLSEVVQGIYLALEAFTEPGQGVVVQTPIYPPFLHSLRQTGRRLVENRLVESDTRFEIDFDGLAEGIDSETRVLLFCNPHNPSGRVFSRTELERIAETVLRHELIVVSDEIHADLLYDGRAHVPFASLSPEIAGRTVTLTSPSKAFNIPGLRCAIAHFGSSALKRRFTTVMPRHFRGGIGLFGIYASITAWRWAQPWLDEVIPYLEANRDFVAAALTKRIPEAGFFSPEATYLGWIDCRGLEISKSPAAHFLAEGRVALSDGAAFGTGWEKHVRLNFATSRPILTEVIDRMAKAMGR